MGRYSNRGGRGRRGGRGGGGRQGNAKAAPPPTPTSSALNLKLVVSTDVDIAASECPAKLVEGRVAEQDGDRHIHHLDLVNWTAVKPTLAWFKEKCTRSDSAAQLSFSPALEKDHRKSIHAMAQQIGLETMSEGVGDERHIIVGKEGFAPAKPDLSEKEQHKLKWMYTWANEAGLKVSVDEVADMLLTARLTPEVERVWGAKTAEQKAVAALCTAALENDLEALQEACDATPEAVRSGAFDCLTELAPLHCAASKDNVAALEALIAAGSPLESRDGHGDTPLQVARRFEKQDAEAALLRAGAKDSAGDRIFSREVTVPDRSSPAGPAEPLAAEKDSTDAAPTAGNASMAADPEQADEEPADNAAAAEVHTLEQPDAEQPGKEDLIERASEAAVEATLPAAGEGAEEEKPPAATPQEGPPVEEASVGEQSMPVEQAQSKEAKLAEEDKDAPLVEAPAGAVETWQEEVSSALASEQNEGSHADGNGKAPSQDDEAPAADVLPNDKAPFLASASGCIPVPNGTHAEAPEEDVSAASPASSEASQADGGAVAGKVRLSLVDKFSELPKPDPPVELPKAAASGEQKEEVQAEPPDASCDAEHLEIPMSHANGFSIEDHSPESSPPPPVDQDASQSPEAALPPLMENAGLPGTSHDASQPSEGLKGLQEIAHSPVKGVPASHEKGERDSSASPPSRANENDANHEAEPGAATGRDGGEEGAGAAAEVKLRHLVIPDVATAALPTFGTPAQPSESEGGAAVPPAEDTFPGFPAVEQTCTEPSASEVPVFMPPVDNAHVPSIGGDVSHVLTPGDAAIAAPPRPWKEGANMERTWSEWATAHQEALLWGGGTAAAIAVVAALLVHRTS